MAQYNPTNYYTTLGDYSNVYVDLGTVYVDLSYNQTIQGIKTYGTAPMTNYASAPYQLVNKQYIDDNYNTLNYKVTMPVVNNTQGALMNPLATAAAMGIPNGFTKKSFTPLQNFTMIQRKMINTQIDAPVNQDTYYTFGVSRPSMWLAGGTSLVTGNSLAYSYDGFNWTGIPSTDISGVRALAFNGSIWVAGCGGPNSSATDNLYGGTGARTTLAYSYNGFNWVPNYYANSVFNTGVYGLAWNGLIFVAAGQGGNALAYSYDGIRWTGATSGPWVTTSGAYGTSVAWNGSLWVATGGFGATSTTCYSYNGIVWLQSTANSAPFNSIGNCIAYDGVRWLAGGGNATNTLYMSFNGQAWTPLNIPQSQNPVLGLAWNGQMWVAVGIGSNPIVCSYDGYNWVAALNSGSVFNNTAGGRCIAWNGYMWVAGGGQFGSGSTLAYSYNGLYWYALGPSVFGGACNAIIWGGRRENIIYYPQNRTLLLGSTTSGGPTIQYSNPYFPYQVSATSAGAVTANVDFSTAGYISGTSWNTYYDTASALFAQANGAAWNGYKWIAVGQATNTTYGYGNTMAFSTIIGNTNIGNAGNIWIGMQNRIFSIAGMNVAYNGNIWAAVGQGGNSIAWSPDGNSWFGLGTSIFSNYGQTISWNGSYWLAGGNGVGNTMAFSYDGIVWSGLGNGVFNIQCNGLAWNGTIWVAVGFGTVNTMAYSTDGLNWNGLSRVSFTTQGNDVTVSSSSGLWCAAGAGGNTIVNSTDGVNWYRAGQASSIVTTVCNSVGWNGKYWIASGVGGNTNAWSYDAIIWAGLGTGLFTGGGQRAVWNQGIGTNYIKNNYLVKSNLNTNSILTIFFGQRSTLYYSTNGIQWTAKVQPFIYDTVVGIAYNGRIWAATTNVTASLYSFIYSVDGINWLYAKTPIVDNLGPVYTNGTVFVAGSTVSNNQYYSYDAINWSIGVNQSITTLLNVFVWNNNNHFWIGMGGSGAYGASAVSTNGVAFSVDGVGWFNMPNCNLTNFVCRSLAWNGIQFVAVGAPSVSGAQNTPPGVGSYSSLWASNDGQRWYYGVLSNPVTTGGLTSTDTFSNTTGGTNVGYGQRSNSGRGVAWNGRLWVACGSGLQYGSNTSIIYSYDGFIWFNQPNNSDPFGATGSANNIFWNGVMFVCNGVSSTGTSQLVYSYNGLNWFTSPYNNNGTAILQTTATSTFMSNSMNNINKVQLYFNGPNQSKTLDIVADTYYNTGYNKTTFYA
jgi:hypothetical protein